MELIPIRDDGSTPIHVDSLPAAAHDVLAQTRAHYARVGFLAPWVGYLALEDDIVVGACSFVAAPKDGEVEIAYFAFPGHEGRGVATRMAKRLLNLALKTDASVVVKAHTLPEENASTAILRKLGFSLSGPIIDPEDGEIWVWRRALAARP
ncbi:MAG: GNAT family N-acetyltransferase [Parvularculaceae bacterium]